MYTLKFSILSYHPSFLTTESIDVGILFNYANDTHFEYTKSFSRIMHFDDELDIDFLKLYLSGIKEDFADDVFNIKGKPNFDEYISLYVNELKFSKPNILITDDVYASIEDTKKIFLRFDYNKALRPDNNQQIKFFNNILKSSNVMYSTRNMAGVYHDERVNYDFLVKDYGIKIFAFENKDTNRLVETAKAWAFTAEEMKAKNINTVFIYDTEIMDKPSFFSIINILKKNGDVYNFNDGIDFLNSLKTS